MVIHARVVVLFVLVLILASVISTPYRMQGWMVKEHLSPNGMEICLGNSQGNSVCSSRDDVRQLFRDAMATPATLCLGDPKVCIDSKQLQAVVNGPSAPTCRDTATPWNEFGSGNYAFLDRHDIRCMDSEKLVRQRVEVNQTANQSRVSYRCCK